MISLGSPWNVTRRWESGLTLQGFGDPSSEKPLFSGALRTGHRGAAGGGRRARRAVAWWERRESNPDGPRGPGDFKSPASAGYATLPRGRGAGSTPRASAGKAFSA